MNIARTILFYLMLSVPAIFAVGISTGSPGTGTKIPPILSELENEISAELNKVDRNLADLAGKFSVTETAPAGKRELLSRLCLKYPYAEDCAFVDREGRLAIIEPGKYSEFEGADISRQEQIIRLRKSLKPVLSEVIRMVEGFDAVDLEHPVFSSQGEFRGSVSILIRPESLLSHIITPVLQGVPVEVFVMQTDGRIIYDEDKEEVGRMLFEDPIYKPFPQLLEVGARIAGEKTGTASYEFMQKGLEKMVMKDAHWTTVGLHGTEWRLVVMHVRPGQAVYSGEEITISGTDSHIDALRTLTENPEIKKAFSRNGIATIREIFKDFYSKHPGLYSVQWLDSLGVNRYGYPEEHSLISFDMKTSRTPSAKSMLQALTEKKESFFESPLIEGKTGSFFMVPIYDDVKYLGMIYTIRLKE
jgi:hypothetical protein